MATLSQLSPPPAPAAATQQKGSKVFDFTKKKRWGDLIVSEAVETIAFIVNASMSVLWCGAAVNDVLGWQESDLLDSELTEYMNAEQDHARFREAFESCLRGTDAVFDIQVRMKVNSAVIHWSHTEQVALEFRGFFEAADVDGEEVPLVFLYARLQRTPPMVEIQDYIDLEMQRVALEQKLLHLRSLTTPEMIAELSPSRTSGDESTSFYSSSNLAARLPESEGTAESKTKHYGSSREENSRDSLLKPGLTTEEELEEGSKKSKLKKSQGSEQHVCITCGQTESPEWRKGPLGPKTLCNACGLRWAKQARKVKPSPGPSNAVDDTSGTPT